MERDQERFYEDENQEQAVAPELEQSAAPEEEVNDMMFFLETLRHLRSAIQSGKNVTLTGKKIIDA